MNNNFNIMGSRKYGIWSFRLFGVGLMLKAPWSIKYFSEREGFRKFYPKNGWRIGFLSKHA